jgi:hypothetical protein
VEDKGMSDEQVEKLFILIEENNENAVVAEALKKLRSHVQNLRAAVDELSVGLEDDWLSAMVDKVLNGETDNGKHI